MTREIERKYLVQGDAWREQADEGVHYRQGYLVSGKHASVRVRTSGAEAWLTIKGSSAGIVREEFEYMVPLSDAERMMATLCQRPLIEKTRYHVPCGDHLWEVDCFEGANAGLVVAEIELAEVEEEFERPTWLGPEVSHLPRYYNANLIDYPYEQWCDVERAGRNGRANG